MPRIFVSYSRRDFYAAEALTSVLAASGQVTPWLDVERLRPGTDWEIAINGAIDAADAVVVVGSPAAMASKWVTEEWQRALRNRTPVHVALVRKTDLPPELTSVHDLRGSFFTEARRLVDVIWGQVVPRPRRRFPVSPQMALLWAALVLCTVTAGVGATLGWDLSQVYRPAHAGMARIGLMLALANAVIVAGLTYLAVRLARRSVSSVLSLWEGFFGAGAVALISLVGVLMVHNRSYRELAGPDARSDSAWLYLAAAAAAVLGTVLLRRSRTVHLEMPTGTGEDHLRRRVRGQRARRRRWRAFDRLWAEYLPKLAELRAATPGVGAATSYAVLCHQDDQHIANLINRACDTAGFAPDAVDPRWLFVVVTNRMSREVIRQVREVHGDRAVFVMATSVRMHEDDAELRRHQWLDFREQNPEGLYDFLRAVVVPSPGDRGVVTVPVDAEAFRAPLYVTGHVLFGQVMLGMAAAPVLGALLGGVLTIPLALVTAALCAMVINLVRRTAARAIDGAGWLWRAVVVLLLFIGWVVQAPNLTPVPAANHAVTGVTVFFVLSSLVFPARSLVGLWLPPTRERTPAELAAAAKLDAVTPPVFSFSLTLAPLVFSAGYFFAVGA